MVAALLCYPSSKTVEMLLLLQVWPNLPASRSAPPWTGPPLLSPKVLALLHLLEEKRAEAGLPDALQQQRQQQQAPQDWWSAIVFVETKVSFRSVFCTAVVARPNIWAVCLMSMSMATPLVLCICLWMCVQQCESTDHQCIFLHHPQWRRCTQSVLRLSCALVHTTQMLSHKHRVSVCHRCHVMCCGHCNCCRRKLSEPVLATLLRPALRCQCLRNFDNSSEGDSWLSGVLLPAALSTAVSAGADQAAAELP
jgi:hypothetical protein